MSTRWSAETLEGERLTILVTNSGVEIEVTDIESGEALSNLKLDPFNAHRLAFVLDAQAMRAL